MKAIKIAYRSTLLLGMILAGCIIVIVFHKAHTTKAGNTLGHKANSWWHKKMTRAMGVPVRVFGAPSNDTTLFVANHISWFDINAFGSILPVRFLAKIEVKQMPIMGWVASRAGTLFIHRGGKTASNDTIDSMTEALNQKHHVMLFAEGTTQDGTVNRFHSRLVQSAINAECHIQPVAIRYPSPNGEHAHPAALFIGDTTIGQSVLNIMTAKNLFAEIHFLEPIKTNGRQRGELASYAEEQVRNLIESATVSR